MVCQVNGENRGKASIFRQPDAIPIESQIKVTLLANSIHLIVEGVVNDVLELLSIEKRQNSPQYRFIASGGCDSLHLPGLGIPGGYPASLDPN